MALGKVLHGGAGVLGDVFAGLGSFEGFVEQPEHGSGSASFRQRGPSRALGVRLVGQGSFNEHPHLVAVDGGDESGAEGGNDVEADESFVLLAGAVS